MPVGKITQRISGRAWAQLFRLPNLFTVPGEPLAGFVLAHSGPLTAWGQVGWALTASLAFYMAGLAWNDYYDYAEDLRVRPDRPLPRGDLTPRAVRTAAGVLAVLGWLACIPLGTIGLGIGTVLLLAVFCYNRMGKAHAGLGITLLGMCRGLSLLLGVAAAGEPQAWTHKPVGVALLVTAAYIIAVSRLARREMEVHRPKADRWAPLFVWSVGALLFAPLLARHHWEPPVGFLALILIGSVTAWRGAQALRPFARHRLPGITHVLPPWIGRLIAASLFWHAAVIMGSGNDPLRWIIAFTLGACWLLNRWTARFFYAS